MTMLQKMWKLYVWRSCGVGLPIPDPSVSNPNCRDRDRAWSCSTSASAKSSSQHSLWSCSGIGSNPCPSSTSSRLWFGNWTRSHRVYSNPIPSPQVHFYKRWFFFFEHISIHLTLIKCHREIQQLTLPLRKLRIGTYVASASPQDVPDGQNPYHPIATATLNTTVFNVVHMFSERSISAVPIINENGIVVNLYETVDVIVSSICLRFYPT